MSSTQSRSEAAKAATSRQASRKGSGRNRNKESTTLVEEDSIPEQGRGVALQSFPLQEQGRTSRKGEHRGEYYKVVVAGILVSQPSHGFEHVSR